MGNATDRPFEARPHRANLKDEVADHIRDLVFSGRLRPHERIDQDQLAADVGVSKLPVREALISLENEGIMESVPRRGVFVASLTPEDILDHYRIYAAVLGIAAGRAAVTLSDQDLGELGDMHARMASEASITEKERLNYEFHRKINLAGGSKRLLGAVTLLSRTMPSHFYEFSGGWADIAVGQHGEILQAIRDSDSARSTQSMVNHIESGGRYAVRQLRESGFWGESEQSLENHSIASLAP